MAYNVLGDLQELEFNSSVTCKNKCAILTKDNFVCLMDNLTLNNYVNNTALTTLPETMRPTNIMVKPCYLLLNGIKELTPVTINSNGDILLDIDVSSGTLYFNGFNFCVDDTYYNNEIGNNFPSWTSNLEGE